MPRGFEPSVSTGHGFIEGGACLINSGVCCVCKSQITDTEDQGYIEWENCDFNINDLPILHVFVVVHLRCEEGEPISKDEVTKNMLWVINEFSCTILV